MQGVDQTQTLSADTSVVPGLAHAKQRQPLRGLPCSGQRTRDFMQGGIQRFIGHLETAPVHAQALAGIDIDDRLQGFQDPCAGHS